MKQSGFTLLEVMVAMLVLAIGLLGLAGLMTSSMRDNLSASHRTAATWMAYDIIDRMRANRVSALTAGTYDTAMGSPAPCAAVVTGGAVNVQDVLTWKSKLACTLPSGDGSVVVNAGTRVARIVIQWDDSRGTRGAAAQTFSVETQL